MIFDDLTTYKFKDKTIVAAILKIIEIFSIQNKKRSEDFKKYKSRDDLLSLLKDLTNHLESYMIKKFSENFIVLICEGPTYNLKYDAKYFMAMKYGTFEILIYKIPHICLPSLYERIKPSEVNLEE